MLDDDKKGLRPAWPRYTYETTPLENVTYSLTINYPEDERWQAKWALDLPDIMARLLDMQSTLRAKHKHGLRAGETAEHALDELYEVFLESFSEYLEMVP